MDLIGWIEDQKEENMRSWTQFRRSQSLIWKPTNIFNQCCVKWLADGNTNSSGDGYGYDQYSFRNGCAGRCNRDHPTITLSYDQENGTLATVSHLLVPFLNYFQQRIHLETAFPKSRWQFHLNGFVRENLTDLKRQRGFGGHLVKLLLTNTLEDSDKAYNQQIDGEQQLKQKRARVEMDMNTFEEAMDVVLLHRLQEDLEVDPMSLHCMRKTSLLFRTIASGIAVKKMKSLNISVTPLVNGLEQHGEDKIDGYDSENWKSAGGCDYDIGQVYRYDKMDKKELEYREEESCFAVPLDKDDDFHWRSPWLLLSDAARYDECDSNSPPCTDDYIGQRLKIYWHPVDGDLVKAKPRGYYGFHRTRPPLGVLLGERSIPADVRLIGTRQTIRFSNISLDYEVIESNSVEEVVASEEEDYDEEVASDEEHDDKDRGNNGNNEEKIIQKSGCIKIHKVTIDFAALVHQHALILERQLRMQNSKIKKERPLSPSEEAYYSLVSLAALK